MTKYLLTILTMILVALTTLFAWIFVNRWKMPFNSEGKYFDAGSGVVYHQQSVIVYGLITIFLLLITVLTRFFARGKYK